jgi:hypothetical protein
VLLLLLQTNWVFSLVPSSVLLPRPLLLCLAASAAWC